MRVEARAEAPRARGGREEIDVSRLPARPLDGPPQSLRPQLNGAATEAPTHLVHALVRPERLGVEIEVAQLPEARRCRREMDTIGRLESPRSSYATPAPSSGTTRASRRRQLPTNHSHAARPLGATRAYQRDSSSKPLHPSLRVAALRNSSEKRGSDPPKNSLDGRSFHIS